MWLGVSDQCCDIVGRKECIGEDLGRWEAMAGLSACAKMRVIAERRTVERQWIARRELFAPDAMITATSCFWGLCDLRWILSFALEALD